MSVSVDSESFQKAKFTRNGHAISLFIYGIYIHILYRILHHTSPGDMILSPYIYTGLFRGWDGSNGRLRVGWSWGPIYFAACVATITVHFRDDARKWKNVSQYWPFVWRIQRLYVDYLHIGLVMNSLNGLLLLALTHTEMVDGAHRANVTSL